jgi:hypothetical protein
VVVCARCAAATAHVDRQLIYGTGRTARCSAWTSPREPIVDAEVIEPEPDGTDLPQRSPAEGASCAGRKTYTFKDFER